MENRVVKVGVRIQGEGKGELALVYVPHKTNP